MRATITLERCRHRSRVIKLLNEVLETQQAHHQEMEIKMGVVATALNTVNEQLAKAKAEIVGKIDELLARETLDDADRAALEAVKASAQSLDDIVPDAVVVPLPDPEDTGDLDPADPDVIDPADPVAPVEEVPAEEAPVEEVPAPAEPADPSTEIPTQRPDPEV